MQHTTAVGLKTSTHEGHKGLHKRDGRNSSQSLWLSWSWTLLARPPTSLLLPPNISNDIRIHTRTRTTPKAEQCREAQECFMRERHLLFCERGSGISLHQLYNVLFNSAALFVTSEESWNFFAKSHKPIILVIYLTLLVLVKGRGPCFRPPSLVASLWTRITFNLKAILQ